MARRTTTVRLPDELAETAEAVARAREISFNTLVVQAIEAELDRVRHDDGFMTKLKNLVERDREILDRLAR